MMTPEQTEEAFIKMAAVMGTLIPLLDAVEFCLSAHDQCIIDIVKANELMVTHSVQLEARIKKLEDRNFAPSQN